MIPYRINESFQINAIIIVLAVIYIYGVSVVQKQHLTFFTVMVCQFFTGKAIEIFYSVEAEKSLVLVPSMVQC